MIIDFFCTKDKRWKMFKNYDTSYQEHKFIALYRYVNYMFNPRPPSAKKENIVTQNTDQPNDDKILQTSKNETQELLVPQAQM